MVHTNNLNEAVSKKMNEADPMEIYKEYEEQVLSAYSDNRKAAFEINDYLHNSTVCYHGRCVYTLQIPKIYTKAAVDYFSSIVEKTYVIFDKIMEAYLKDPEYRNSFGFSKEMEDLILIKRGYTVSLPIARFDIFFNEENFDFKYCEINTDGTSAMNEDYVLNQAFDLNPAHRILKKKYDLKSFELYDSWVREFINIYSTYPDKKEKPYIAIVDFLETGSITEFEEFEERFKKAGYDCEVSEITKLNYKNGVLYSPKGHPIDVIYRRAVTRDVLENSDTVQDFLQAVRDGAVCLIGSFATQIIHNKILFKVIHEEKTLQLLTDDEQEFVKKHFPYTAVLGDGFVDKKELLENKDHWLVKPMDSYASRGVYAGCDQTDEKWADIIEDAWNTDYIVQEYCKPYCTRNISFVTDDTEFKPYTNMSGLFVYGGKFAGVYSRLSDGGIISSQYNERSVPSYYL